MAIPLVPTISGSPQQYLSYFLNALSCKFPKKSRFFQKKWDNLQNTKLLKTFIYARFPPFFICDNGYGSIDPLFYFFAFSLFFFATSGVSTSDSFRSLRNSLTLPMASSTPTTDGTASTAVTRITGTEKVPDGVP